MQAAVWKTKRSKYLCQEHATHYKRALIGVDAKEGWEHKCDVCRARQMKRVLRYRTTVCAHCYNNRYNYQSEGDLHNAPTSGDGCFHIGDIRNNHCSIYENLIHYRSGNG